MEQEQVVIFEDRYSTIIVNKVNSWLKNNIGKIVTTHAQFYVKDEVAYMVIFYKEVS